MTFLEAITCLNHLQSFIIFFQYTHLRDAHFYRCKLIEHTVQFYFLNTKASHYLDWMFLMTEQANVFLKRLRYIKNAMKNSLSYFMRPAEISSHFMLIRMTSQNAKYSAIDKKKSHLNQEIKKLIKKIFSLSYTMSNAMSNAIKSPPHR